MADLIAGAVPPALAAACLALAMLAGNAAAQQRESLGASVQGLIAAGRELSPALRAAALESEAAAARASGAGALDDPTISDSYQYYKDPGVFSAQTVTVSQAFPLWGKRDLRREAAQADVDAARGREQAARDELDEKIKVAFAQHAVLTRSPSTTPWTRLVPLARKPGGPSPAMICGRRSWPAPSSGCGRR